MVQKKNPLPNSSKKSMVREPIRQIFFVWTYVLFRQKCEISKLVYASPACKLSNVRSTHPIHPWKFQIFLKVADGSKTRKSRICDFQRYHRIFSSPVPRKFDRQNGRKRPWLKSKVTLIRSKIPTLNKSWEIPFWSNIFSTVQWCQPFSILTSISQSNHCQIFNDYKDLIPFFKSV